MNVIIVFVFLICAVSLYVFTLSFGFTRCKKCKSWSVWKDVHVSYDDHRPNLRFVTTALVCSKCKTVVANLGTKQEIVEVLRWK